MSLHTRQRFHAASLRRKNINEVTPFSWALFVLAVFHFSVWSLGVACPPAQGYFQAHTVSLKTCDGQTAVLSSLQQLQLLAAQSDSEQQEKERLQEARKASEREAAEAIKAAQTHAQQAQLQAAASLGSQLSTLLLLQALAGSAGSGAEQPAAHAFRFPALIRSA